ncbi:hypothetical protein DTL42_23370 [Bremerella cremea]|uniref:Uncharacterized protein n=1 Tax=Bremerella cremea TaxID=1031537 RepID=A0A368KLC2_9BACT|nr:hypothetical protein [Bremerella cremea]RCS41494.1 hypothetical protein DTL42_23370 [Bremerella cremea]
MSETPYQRLVALAQSVHLPDYLQYLDKQTDLSELSRVVNENRHILNDARQCLTPECCVPLTFEQDFFKKHGPELVPLRELACSFRLEAELAQLDRQLDQVVNAGLDLLRLGNALRRGGLIVDMLTASSISLTGVEQLRKVRAEIDQERRAEWIKLLPQLEQEIESIGIIIARDQQWEKATGNEDEEVDFEELEEILDDDPEIPEEVNTWITQQIEEMASWPEADRHGLYRNQDRRLIAHLRMLTIDLALRTFYRATDRYPGDLSQLTPSILPNVPLAPFTGKPFLYAPTATSFQLATPGPSGSDTGVLGPWPMVLAGEAILNLDENDFWAEK